MRAEEGVMAGKAEVQGKEGRGRFGRLGKGCNPRVRGSLDATQSPIIPFEKRFGGETELRRALYSGRRKWFPLKNSFLDLRERETTDSHFSSSSSSIRDMYSPK